MVPDARIQLKMSGFIQINVALALRINLFPKHNSKFFPVYLARLKGIGIKPPAKRLDQSNRCDKPQAGKLGRRPFSRESITIGIHHFDIADHAGTIAFLRQARRLQRIRHGTLLRRKLVGQVFDAGKAVLHIAES